MNKKLAKKIGLNVPETKWYDKALPVVLKVVDWLLSALAAGFFLAVSYLYVRDFIREHFTNGDISVIGAILVLAVGLHLLIRPKLRR